MKTAAPKACSGGTTTTTTTTTTTETTTTTTTTFTTTTTGATNSAGSAIRMFGGYETLSEENRDMDTYRNKNGKKSIVCKYEEVCTTVDICSSSSR